MRLLIWIILAVALAREANGLAAKVIEKLSSGGDTCDLRYRDEGIECETYLNVHEVAENTICWEYDNDEIPVYYRCKWSLWIQEPRTVTTSVQTHRHRRWGAIGAVIVGGLIGGPVGAAVACIIFCGGGGGGGVEYVHVPPPTFTVCKPEKTHYLILKESITTTEVTYPQPKATDKDGDVPQSRLIHEAGPASGSTANGDVGGKQHLVIYKAQDTDGNSVYCNFALTVEVRGCRYPQHPTNGYTTCTPGTLGIIFGDTCRYNCQRGFKLNGANEVKCEFDGSWSAAAPACEVIKCGSPTDPDHGTVHCSNPAHEYPTACFLQCDIGYDTRTAMVSTCQTNGEWLFDFTDGCKDVEAPTIDCSEEISELTFYAERASNSTLVTWSLPPVSDNVDTSSTINIFRSDSGYPQNGTILAVGSYSVKYRASDTEGNTSPECQITIDVQEITCDNPRDAIGDAKMEINCTRPSYTYGTECELYCNFNLPLNGTNNITCEKDDTSTPPVGIWSFVGQQIPSCTLIDCPPLDPPLNGAIINTTQNLRPLAMMQCNDMYDIPPVNTESFNGVFLCTDSGWYPNDYVPDCTETRHPQYFRLPAYLTYSGDCSDAETQNEIKQKFLENAQTMLIQFDNDCPDDLSCALDNIHVNCGLTNRKKRQVLSNNYFNVSFELVLEVNMSGITDWIKEVIDVYDPAIASMKTTITQYVSNDNLDLPGFDAITFGTDDYADFSCQGGHFFKDGKCKMCPRGYVLESGNTVCTICAKGTYAETEGGSVCTACPDGYSTKKSGSKSSSDCIKLCANGSASDDTMEPCQLCSKGQYQNGTGQSQCFKCPSGKTTKVVGSKQEDDCKDFSALMRGDNGTSVSAEILSDSQSIALTLWMRNKANVTKGLTLTVGNSQQAEPSIVLSVLSETFLTVSGTEHTRIETFQDSNWHMVTLVLDGSSGVFNLYFDGDEVLTESFSVPLGNLVSSGSIFRVQTTSDTYITGFSLSTQIPSSLEIMALRDICSAKLPGAAMDMNIFTQSESGIVSLIVPTSCDPINECKGNPCGEHKCINGVGDYTCECSNRFTGKNCTVPPDHCENHECQYGSTCLSHAYNYTCQCVLGYNGDHCQIPPVNGGWGDWTHWSDCDVTCGTGVQIRSRECDNPVKDAYGQDCEGPASDTRACGLAECRSCSVIGKRTYGMITTCEGSEENTTTCTFKCRDGLVLASGLQQQSYRCGKLTNYEWEPNFNPVSCSRTTRPEYLLSYTSTTVSPEIPDTDIQDAKQKYLESVSSTPCVTNGTCKALVSITNTAGKKRSTGSTIVTITFNTTFKETGDLDLEAFFTNSTVSPALREWINALVDLEVTAQTLSNDSASVLNITVGNVTYNVVSSSTTATINCNEGYCAAEGVCAACPSGTRYESGYCVSCEKGTYQDQTAQTACVTCPAGFSTVSAGSLLASDCSVAIDVDVMPSSTDADTTTSTSLKIESTNNYGIIIGASVAGSLFLFGIAVLTVVIYKWKSKRPVYERGRSLSDIHIHPKIYPDSLYTNADVKANICGPMDTVLKADRTDQTKLQGNLYN